jgi:hypothetical protein
MIVETSIVIEPKLPDFAEAARFGIREAALAIQERAVKSIKFGKKTGRVYDHYFVTIKGRAVPIETRSRSHQASAPGEAPASDEGRLTDSISADFYPMAAEIGSGANHGLYLEEGTDKIAPRPWLKPAADENTVVDAFVRAFRRAG